MIVVDGAQGEGGGQIFRSTLTLSLCTGQPVRLINIRAGRKKPGLLRQHLTCLNAAQTISNADITGDELGSQTVTFVPEPVQWGNYYFAIGSAGSTTLVFQTLFLPLARCEGVSHLQLEGGTHNDLAPSVDFMEHCFLPVAEQLGWQADSNLERYGFAPKGGGIWHVQIQPVGSTQPLHLLERGKIVRRYAQATSANIAEHVTQRELASIQQQCQWSPDQLQQALVESPGPGNILSLRLEMPRVTALFETVGARGKTAERVATKAVTMMNDYLGTNAVVCEYLADQLILPMVLGSGGSFTTSVVSQHLRTNIDVVCQLTGADIQLEQVEDRCWRVTVAPMDG